MTKINSFDLHGIYSHNNTPPYVEKKSDTIVEIPLPLDQTIPSFNLFGINISGISTQQIDAGKLIINAPLNSGNKSIVGVNEDVLLFINKDTVAHVEIDVGQNEKNQLVMKNVSISFSKNIIVKNPATSLLKESRNSPIFSSLKDKIADVELKKISVNSEGKIAVIGHIKALKIFNKDLSPEFGSITLPALNEALFERLGIGLEKKQISKHQVSQLDAHFDVKNILKKLGAITGTAPFSLRIEGAPSQIALMKDGKRVQGKESDFLVNMSGVLDLNPAGELAIVVKRRPQQLLCSLGSFAMNGRIKVSPNESGLALNINGEISGLAQGITLDGATEKNLEKALPKRRLLEREPSDNPDLLSTNYVVGASEFLLNSKVNIDANVASKNSSIDGSAKVTITARNPFLKTRHRGAKLSGNGALTLDINKFSVDTVSGIRNARAHASVDVVPHQEVLTMFPEMKPINLGYKIKIKDNKAQIKPPEFGLLRFVRPLVNLEGHHERVNTKMTRHAFHPIGTKEYFDQVKKITGAQLRDAQDVKLLIDGTQSMPERMRMIAEAKNDICFQTLEFKNDNSGWLFAQALVAARQRGVKVYGIVDSVGNINAINDLEQKNPIYDYLISNGVALTVYNSSFENGLRRIFNVTKKYPLLFGEPFEKSLKNISMLLDYLEIVACTVDDAESKVSRQDQQELAKGIRCLFHGKECSSPHLFVNEFKEILSQSIVDTNNLLLALKRLGTLSYRSHEKYLIVDGEQAIVGGMNIADEYLRGGSDELINVDGRKQLAWRDSDVLLRGDIVRDVYRCFRRNWLHNAHERLPFKSKALPSATKSDCRVSMIQHRPWEDGDDNIVNFLLYNLRTLKAGEKAWFETAYFLPRGVLRPLQKELVGAALRGVDVRILTNSKETSDFKSLVEAAVFDYRELLKAGARIFSRNQNRTVHAKVAVLGDTLTTIGSYNLDNRSASHDTEDICALYGEAITREMSGQLLTDMFEQSDEIKLADIQSAPLGDELKAAGMLLIGELI